MTEEIDRPILEPTVIARQFIAEAVVNLRQLQEQAHAEYLADEAAMRKLERSAACRAGWTNRKARLAGATSPADAPEDDE